MLKSTTISATLAAIASDKTKVLSLQVDGEQLEPGQFIPRAKAQSPPTLTYNTTPGPYIAIGIDLDAPFPSFAPFGPFLHWIQSGLQADAAAATAVLAAASVPPVANYLGSAPPPGSGPHRYLFLLYAQPEGFDASKHAPPNGKAMGKGARVRFDLDAFEKKAGLGEVLAANYFTCN